MIAAHTPFEAMPEAQSLEDDAYSSSCKNHSNRPSEKISQRVKRQKLGKDLVEPIAIVGLSIKFPDDATSLESFWKMLIEGRSAMTDYPASRFNIHAFYEAGKEKRHKVKAFVLIIALYRKYIKKHDFNDDVVSDEGRALRSRGSWHF